MNVKLLTLFFLLCTSYQATAALSAYNISNNNFNGVFDEIAARHQDDFELDGQGIGVGQVRNYLLSLLKGGPSDDNIEAPSMCIEKNHENTLFINVDGESEAFHFSYLKFSDAFNQSIPNSTNEFSVTIENGWQSSLLALYVTSNGIRSGLYIIIIDKDLAFCNSVCEGSREVVPRYRDDSNDPAKADKISLQSFPNPTIEQTQLTFQLEKAQNVSLQIVSLSTGRIIARKLENQYFPEGKHQYDIDMQAFPAGRYLLILRTENQRQSIPIVKIE